MQEKLKSWLRNDQVFYGLLLILVAVGSFALGRLSVIPLAANHAPGVDFIATTALPMISGDLVMPSSTQPVKTKDSGYESDKSNLSVVASKSGTKYHLPSCAGAKQIKPNNLISFSNREEAEKAGYTPAANCPGL